MGGCVVIISGRLLKLLILHGYHYLVRLAHSFFLSVDFICIEWVIVLCAERCLPLLSDWIWLSRKHLNISVKYSMSDIVYHTPIRPIFHIAHHKSYKPSNSHDFHCFWKSKLEVQVQPQGICSCPQVRTKIPPFLKHNQMAFNSMHVTNMVACDIK